YRPGVVGAGQPGEKPYTYRLAGTTCLAGDVIGDYSFDAPLRAGDRVVFEDMAHYTMVKNNLFNGVRLPSIALYTESDGLRVLRSFGYDEYRNRLS
ncbi:MAG: carboxynorspermidine decarboxylase, partial [Clostridia bacterium]|nr:carboxynorspermidine decarboxylase [Clostridia bacterium]